MASAGRNYHLLIIDDDVVDQRHYRHLLAQQTMHECHIDFAGDGATGLAMLRTRQVDCILLDFNLPDMTGIEFIKSAMVDGELPCAVVIITGQGSDVIAVEAMKLGAHDYLSKDRVNPSSLWRAMSTAVAQSELSRRLARSLHDLKAANAALEQEAATRKAAEAELRAAKDAAEHANRAKTRFVAMVTHELRTPLNGILGYAQLLRLEHGLSPRQDSQVVAMMQAGHHLLEMIERVLDFASIEAGRMELDPVTVSVRDLCEQCIAFIGPMAAEHALALRLVTSHDASRQIQADPSRLRQVLLNLLGNAVKYTDHGSVELRVLAGATPGGLRFEVADTGPGISESDRSVLFQDFERLSAATSIEGTGLGLAIAARIVGLMNGAIGHSDNPGGGSVFWLELPNAEAAKQEPAPSVPAAPPAVSLSRKRILVVDDIAMNRDVIGAFLCSADHTVVLADSGREAIRIAASETIDLILMDVRMPDMDGLEATRRIRALPPPHGQVPILALTAYSFLDQVTACRNAGMNGHISKPVDFASLMSAISNAIGREPSRWNIDAPPATAAELPDDEPPPPRLDRTILAQLLEYLRPVDIALHQESLRHRIEQMISLLDHGAPVAQLTDAAHTLGSAAGMFGFMALFMVTRRLERTLADDAPGTDQLMQAVRTEAFATLAALETLIRETRMQNA